jgi:hypothetical protein
MVVSFYAMGQVQHTRLPNDLPKAQLDSVIKDEQYLGKLADTLFNKLHEKVSPNDSLAEELDFQSEDIFIKAFENVLRKPYTFGYDFPALADFQVDVTHSNDRKMKIYDWESPFCGSMFIMPSIIQYQKSPNKTIVHIQNVHQEDSSVEIPMSHYYSVYHICDSPYPLYLTIAGGQGDYGHPFEIVEGFIIAHDSITKSSNLFKLDSEFTNSIFVPEQYYRFHADPSGMESPIVTYDRLSKVLTFPDLTKDDDATPTGKSIKLKFNGKYFSGAKNK